MSIFYLLIGLNQNEAVAINAGNTVDGTYISVSQNSLVSVTEVTGNMVTTKIVGYLGVRQQLRPPCVSCPHGYNILWVNVTNETSWLIIPDNNALKIANEDGKYETTVTLSDCEPYLLHPLPYDHSILWVLCNPVGNEARVYRVSLMNFTTEPPLVVHTDSGPFLSQVGVVYEKAGTLHVILATANGLAFTSQNSQHAQVNTLEVACSSVLRMTGLLSMEILMECGNRGSSTVENTYLFNYDDSGFTDVHLRSGRKLGKIITSDDVSIFASVAPNGIDILERNQNRVGQVVPTSNHEFHDAYIESVAGSHLMVYSDKGGKVHLYNVSAALNGDDVSSQTIEGDYVTCMNCSGLLRIGEGYFVTATDPEGVGWFSTMPPKLLRTSRGIKADRLAYSSSKLPTEIVNSLDISRIVGGVIGGVAGLVLFIILVVVAGVGIVYIWKKPWR